MICPNCNIDLIIHTTGKDVPCSGCTDDYDSEFDIGRVAIMACPKCQYCDESTMRINFHG
jgi:hypothetical protein